MIAVCLTHLLLLICLLLVPVATDAFRQTTPAHGVFISSVRSYKQHEGLFLSQSNDSKPDTIVSTICMLIESDDEESDQFREDAQSIANTLGIPLLSTLENKDIDKENDKSNDGEQFTHALKLVPYEYVNDKLILSVTFALAIEPIGSSGPVSEGRRGRRNPKKPKKKKSSSSLSFFVDLCPPPNSKAGRRASGSSGKGDLLVKAVAPWKGSENGQNQREGAVIWDLTAGLGQDSLILARNGAKTVTMVERHPVVAALLQDAMRRLELVSSSVSSNNNSSVSARDDDDVSQKNPSQHLGQILKLSIGEGREILQKEDPSDCDVIYLDPMFPPRQKQSAVKKGMSILHGLLETHIASSNDGDNDGNDGNETGASKRQTEEQELLTAALAVAKLRVVVKRPIKAPLLGDGSTKPSHALSGSFNRWDVYVKPPSIKKKNMKLS